MLFGLWYSLGFFLSQKTQFLSIFKIVIIASALVSMVCSWTLPCLLTLRNQHMLLVIPLPCCVSLGLPPRDHPLLVLSLCSCSAPGLGSDRWHHRLPWRLLQRGHLGNSHQTVLWEHPPPPPSCPTHISTSSSLWDAARPSWAPLPVVLGWQSVAPCLLVGIWDLGRQMALELELKPFQQCHSDFRLLLPCS